MKKLTLILLSFLLFSVTPLGAQIGEGPSKLDPMLRHAIREERERGGIQTLTPGASGVRSVIVLSPSPRGSVADVFVRSTDVAAAAREVLAAGGTVGTRVGELFTASIPVRALEAVAGHASVVSLQASVLSHAQLNVSRVESKADAVLLGTGLPHAIRGAGVVVGVVDSGIDWSHGDFKTAAGSRIQYLWDMSGTSSPPAGYTYGREYTKAQIDAGQCLEKDGVGGGGHGTHVAGTAAGNGATLAGYSGMAPEADIIFVKASTDPDSQGGFSQTKLVDAFAYIFARAGARPAVVNMSIGGGIGSHDGMSSYEQMLSGMTGPGRIIVVSNGNDGSKRKHVSYTADPARFLETGWLFQQGEPSGIADLWYSTGSLGIGVGAYSVVNGTLTLVGASAEIAPGGNLDPTPIKNANGQTLGLVSVDATSNPDPSNGAKRAFVVIDSNNGAFDLSETIWTLYAHGTGTLDAWISGGELTANTGTNVMPADTNKTVTIPATARKVIAVGAYVTKDTWTDVDGTGRTVNSWCANPPPNDTVIPQAACFTSRGPTRDGRVKPEIAAPGMFIVAPLSKDVTVVANNSGLPGVDRQFVLSGGKYRVEQGTSMAAPHVTGIVALMLAANPALTYETALAALQLTARTDGTTGATPNNTWGAGRVDALAAVKNVLPATTNFTLSVTRSGAGTGTVTSNTGGISCGATCSASYASGSQVVLTAAAAAGSTFTGWSGGGCGGTGTCTVPMTQNQNVTATFGGTGGGGCTPGQLIVDGDLEAGNGPAGDSGTAGTSGPWVWTATGGYNPIQQNVPSYAVPTHSGSWAIYLNNYRSAETDSVYQTVTIPAGASATLSFWLFMETAETSQTVKDTLDIQVINATGTTQLLERFSNLDAWNQFVQKTYDVSAFAGQTVRIQFLGTQTGSLGTAHYIDDVSLTITCPQPVTYTLSVAKSGNGSGTVTSSPAGISCGATCSASYSSGSQVVLTAAAGKSSTFGGWSGGGCGGTGTCTVSMTQTQSVTATFLGSAPTIRLANGQVEVSVTYNNPYSGEGGNATPTPQNDSFAYFYYTDPQNPEVFVKALDFGVDYRIFFGGLTDFEATATFRNVASGATVILHKAPYGDLWAHGSLSK